MRVAMAVAIAGLAAAQTPDAHEIVQRSLTAAEGNWKIARNYTFLEREEERHLDSEGRVKTKEVKTYDITLLEGSPYLRLTERDDHPLAPAEENKEREKLEKSIAERRKETPAERQRRIDDYDRRRQRQRETMREVAEAFDFRVAGQDRIDGRDVWILDATPRRSYNPRSRDAKILPHVRGKLWIDQRSYLVRLDRGARIWFDQTLVNDEVWLPKRVSITASARLGVFKKIRVEQQTTFWNFRKFQTDSRLVAIQ
jgi:hypothetical protein